MDKKKILAVDDDQDILGVIGKRLTDDGFEVELAATGTDAVNQAQKFLPDLILMDIVLPDIDGSEVVKRLSNISETKNIPIVFLSGIVTGEGNAEEVSEVRVAGRLFPAIGKPFTYDQLSEQIHLAFSG